MYLIGAPDKEVMEKKEKEERKKFSQRNEG